MSEQSNLRISLIKLKNYRTFVGEDNTIEFKNEPEKPVNVIHGISGKGKTTILNAVHWCIYGNEKRSSKIQKEADEGIVHSYIIDNMKEGQTEEATVQVTMEDEGGLAYDFIRTITIKKISSIETKEYNDVLQANTPKSIDARTTVIFSYRDVDSDEIKRDDNEYSVKARIEKIFPDILSSYILFDAELLREFENQTEETTIKGGMETITGLPIVSDAIKNLQRRNKKIIKTSSKGSMALVTAIEDQDRFEGEQKKLIEKIEKDSEEVEKTERDLEEISTFLLNHNDERVQEKEKRSLGLKKDIDHIITDIGIFKTEKKKDVFDNLYKFYLRDAYLDAEKKFTEYQNEGLIPSKISKESLLELIKESECICGRPLNESDQTSLDKVKKMMDRVYDSSISQEITIGRTMIQQFINDTQAENYENLKKTCEKNDLGLSDARTEKSQKSAERTQLDATKEPNLNEILEEKQSQKLELEKRITKLKYSLGSNTEKNNLITQNLEKKNREVDKLKKEEIKDTVITNKIKLTEFAQNVLIKASDALLDEFRIEAQSRAEEYFLNTAPRKEDFKSVTIDENFSIRARRKDGAIKALSQGQAHCLGLSYISAIRTITKKNYFMMIDSPFHNISQEAKLQLCKELPTKMKTTQVTFLTTDIEYRGLIPEDDMGPELESARKMLKKNNLLSKEYTLEDKKINDDYKATIIEEK